MKNHPTTLNKKINRDTALVSIIGLGYVGLPLALYEKVIQKTIRVKNARTAEPIHTSEVNIMGTIKLLTAAAKVKVRRFVYAASSSAYGDQPVQIKDEKLLPRPLSPYAAAKLVGEYFCQAYSSSMGLETVGLRYFNVFGPRQDPTSQYSAVIPLFITAVMEERRPTVYGDGTQTRDFTYVANNVQANILAATTSKNVAGKIINIACGSSFSVLDLLKTINQVLDKKIEPIFAPPAKAMSNIHLPIFHLCMNC